MKECGEKSDGTHGSIKGCLVAIPAVSANRFIFCWALRVGGLGYCFAFCLRSPVDFVDELFLSACQRQISVSCPSQPAILTRKLMVVVGRKTVKPAELPDISPAAM